MAGGEWGEGSEGRERNMRHRRIFTLTLVLGSAPHSSRKLRHLACLPVVWRQ